MVSRKDINARNYLLCQGPNFWQPGRNLSTIQAATEPCSTTVVGSFVESLTIVERQRWASFLKGSVGNFFEVGNMFVRSSKFKQSLSTADLFRSRRLCLWLKFQKFTEL